MARHSKQNPTYRVIANTNRDGSGVCSGGSCPTVYETDEDSVIVQGYIARDKFEGDFIPAGEDVVQIPKGLLRQLVANGSLD